MRILPSVVCLFILTSGAGCGSSPSESAVATNAVEVTRQATPSDSVVALRLFWEQFQQAAAQGHPESLRDYLAFPLYSFGMPISQADFEANYREIIWPEADSLVQLIRPLDLVATDLSPYQISRLDHPAGYSTMISRREADRQMGMVYFIGKVEGTYQIVGYATSGQ
jgi:hypothetical protein